MKTLLVFAFAIFATLISAEDKLKCVDKGIINLTSKVKPMILKLRSNDPILLDDATFHIDTTENNTQEGIKLDVTASGAIAGLLNFNLIDFDFFMRKVNPDGGGFQFRFAVDFEEIDINITSYKLEGLLGLTKIFGDGELRVKIKNLSLSSKGTNCGILKVKKENNKSLVSLHNLSAEINNFDFEFFITGWLNDEGRSAYLTKLVNTIMKAMLGSDTQRNEFINTVTNLLLKLMDDKWFPLNI